MSNVIVGCALLGVYLIGAIPFAYIVAWSKGVNLYKVGSGNIGASNVGREFGFKYGLLVFVCDFLKGAIPVALIVPICESLSSALPMQANALRALAACLAFLGHLFPIYLGFKGGKGVATGAGVVLVLAPIPMACAFASWLFLMLLTRTISLASIGASVILSVVQLIVSGMALSAWPITAFILAGTLLVIVKHRSNIARLWKGTEPPIGELAMRPTLLKSIHLLALGLWFGGAAFFNFGTATSIFASFKEVVANSPSDRTAHLDIVPVGTTEERQGELASALAGSAVGPVFPRYFVMQVVCAIVALATAIVWWRTDPGVSQHRQRVLILLLGLLSLAVAWPISNHVSSLRLERFNPNREIAESAVAAFATWHLVSLALSFVTIFLAGLALCYASRLPGDRIHAPSGESG